MKRILRSLTFLAAAAVAVPVGAVTWTAIDTPPSGAENQDSGKPGSDSCGAVACQFTVTNGGYTAKFRAYSNSAWMPSDSPGNAVAPVGQNTLTSGGVQVGTRGDGWVAAQNVFYGTDSGFGIKNLVQNQGTISEENNSPEHAIDNREVLDIMVIELPQLGAGLAWDVSSFMLGWAQENGAGTAADVSMFIGGAGLGANYDFKGTCFDVAYSGATSGTGNCANVPTTDLFSSLGFTNITSAIANSGNNVQQDMATAINTASTGNYIVVSGRLGDKDDAFKFKSITAGTVKVPEPGTLALLGLGLFGLVARRRVTQA